MKRILLVTCIATITWSLQARADKLEQGFTQPPPSARPWVYWFPLDGNITSNGITADLEAMARVGIGGVLYMETDQGTPQGPAAFAGPLWRDLIKHACKEANRLGLEINMNNDAGWCGSGGPWITPELSMQKVVWTETVVKGPRHYTGNLPQPMALKNFYRDIAVYAYPTPAANSTLPQFRGKSLETRAEISLRTTFPAVPEESVVKRDKILNLTAQLGSDGRLTWEVPAGKWTILRFGHTSTGRDNHPAPMTGRGLESDKFSKEATKAHFDGLMQKVIDDSKPVAGKTLVATHLDSWETQSQNWTPKFREEFQRRRGYDPTLWLPAMAGRIVESPALSERFLWDVRTTANDLLMDNYAAEIRALANQHGLRLSIEAYGNGPFNNLMFGGRADEPMGEFWSWNMKQQSENIGAAITCTEMSSAAHVYGKPILGAEAFTAANTEKWQGHPANIKALGDWAFCEGINRFVFHRYALQPWTNPDHAPGISMGPWGLHYERTQTWWEQSKAWHDYLARCQFILQQGLFAADLCFLTAENAPQQFNSPVKSGFERPGYNFDGCPPEVVLTRMSVKDGRLVLPDGMSYRMLVLPQVKTMTPQLLRKIRDLVQAGATVLGNPPVQSPSLSGYPQCDAEVQALARELWGDGPAPAQLTTRSFGQGRVIWGEEIAPRPDAGYTLGNALTGAQWIWSAAAHSTHSAPPGTNYFRRLVNITGAVGAARLVMTADNTFEAWVNGRRVGSGDHYERGYTMYIGGLLTPGTNIITVLADNTSDTPNPAGLIAALEIYYRDGQRQTLYSDATWEAATTVQDKWKTDAGASAHWQSAKVLGPMGIAPWGETHESAEAGRDVILDIAIPSRVLAEQGIAPDFEQQTGTEPMLPANCLRYIHKQLGDTDIYFVANKTPHQQQALGLFRVTGKQPEFWWPDSGKLEGVAVYSEKDGRTQIPLRFDPSGSVFVVFRSAKKAFDPITSVARDGKSLLPISHQKSNITIQQARYGLLDAPEHTRDVTAKIQALVANGKTSLCVTDMAQGDDPAFGEVKTLQIDYLANGEALSVSDTDGSTIKLSIPAPEQIVKINRTAEGRYSVEAMQAGRYELKTAAGKTLVTDVATIPAPQEINGAWDVTFEPNRGAPASAKFDKLISWSESPDAGIKYFSGHATYQKKFDFAGNISKSLMRTYLDLGKVAVMAEVKLNGQDLGILWKPPYRVDVTDALKSGENTLQIKVVNLWINRMIGDEQLPEDSDRKSNGTLKSWPQWVLDGKPSPTGRYTFTSHRLWKKADALVESGLLGPVSIQRVERNVVKR